MRRQGNRYCTRHQPDVNTSKLSHYGTRCESHRCLLLQQPVQIGVIESRISCTDLGSPSYSWPWRNGGTRGGFRAWSGGGRRSWSGPRSGFRFNDFYWANNSDSEGTRRRCRFRHCHHQMVLAFSSIRKAGIHSVYYTEHESKTGTGASRHVDIHGVAKPAVVLGPYLVQCRRDPRR